MMSYPGRRFPAISSPYDHERARVELAGHGRPKGRRADRSGRHDAAKPVTTDDRVRPDSSTIHRTRPF